METLEPRKCRANEKATDLVAAIVKDQRTPVLVFAETWVGMLIKMSAVEAGQREEIARKVSRDPVDDDADVCPMERVDHRHEIER